MSQGSRKKTRRQRQAAKGEGRDKADGVRVGGEALVRREAAPGSQQESVRAEASSPGEFSRGKEWLLALLIVAATVLAYQQAWNAGYIWDDDIYVTGNELLTAPDGLKRIWFSLDSPSQYFPLVYTTFRIEHALWGLHPSGYHWVNILLHAANALLVWRVLRLLKVPGAWLAGALFALHPVHVESVAWITERKNTLMGLFFLLALVAWVRFIDAAAGRRWRFYGMALVCYALALFSKTTACTIPAALLLILWLRNYRIDRARVVQVVPFVVLGLIMGLVTVWWERHHQGTQGEMFAIGLPERVLVASRAVWFYLSKLVWPSDLAFSYPRWDISASDPADYLWVLVCIAAAGLIFFARRYLGRSVEVGMLFFVTQLSPMLGFIMLYTFRYTFVADHYQYIASIGPLALAAAGITLVAQRLQQNFALLSRAVAGVLLLVLGFMTWRQCGIYKDEETLWRATIDVNPSSWMAYNNLAVKLVHDGRVEESLAHYDQALRINPEYAEAHFNLGNALVRLGRSDEALAHYEKAIALFPRFAAAHTNLATLLLQSGRGAEAARHLQRAIEIGPATAALHRQLADVLVRSDRIDEAIGHLTTALQLDPNDAAVHNNLGNLLEETGRTSEAMPHFEKALEIDPANAEAHFNLANALGRSRRPDDAIRHYRRAVEINPAYAAAHNNLANTLAASGQLEEAVASYNKAIETRADFAAAHANLARALRQLGRYDESLAHLQKASEIEERRRSQGTP
jgi:tetratricopeptide (TPR) repeat protein